MKALRFHETGGPEKLRLDEIAAPAPGPGEVRLKVEAVGVNFIEIYQRTGLYPLPLPGIPGMECAGVVESVGPGVTDFPIGTRVATVRAAGSYAERAVAPSAQVVKIPDSVSMQDAAALLLQGMTAHYLATDTFPLKPGDVAVVHAAAGGVGLLLTQLARMRGARVLAVVGSPDKSALARKAGADEVILGREENVGEAVRRLTAGAGAHVVYDSVGKDTFEASLSSLRPRGMLVSFGNASGPVPPFSPLVLSQKGSLFLTRPTLAHYTATSEELQRRADDLFSWVTSSQLHLRIGATFRLSEAAEAHRALESRASTGKLLLIP